MSGATMERGPRSLWLAWGLGGLLLFACNPLGERLSEDSVEAEQKAIALRHGVKLHEACKTGRFEPLGDEATPAMRDGLTPEKQKAACASINGTFGDFQSMTYVETWKVRGLRDRVYRFKGHFSKSQDAPEIRVVLDANGKLSGLWVKPWVDTLL